MFPFNQIWTGPACIVGGLTMLGLQAHAYLQLELISARLLGGGFALLFIGAMTTFYYFDDQRSRARTPAPAEPEWLTHDEPFEADDGNSDSPAEANDFEAGSREDFDRAAQFVLEKNRERYRRLS
jgi:hypothetical protein